MITSDPTFSLKSRIALITGASRGLGRAMAGALADAGATVVLNGRNPSTLQTAVDELSRRGLVAEAAAFNVADSVARRAALASIVARHGRLDVLIANAGVQQALSLDEWSASEWDRLLAVNLNASFFLAQEASASMRRRNTGRIIFIASIADVLGRATIHGYTASKGALVATMRSLAAELGPFGITCNAISPGYFETELTQPLWSDPDFAARVNERVALRRWGKPRDLGGVAVFLASEAASYVTGQEIVVDGGFTTTMF